ncbi:MAG: carboxypeptidase-like regulatory domain-containing protein [Gemmatimonadota bacterium]|nr:carboxypeptidase-like regulatory domain-containing protein [Gemmatimonadota bacterium]
MRALALPLVATLLTVVPAQAQVVRGTAITPDSALVPGVIVTLFDASGTAVARALADDGGSFSMNAPAAGTYHIEAKRIAYRPTVDKPIVLEEGRVLLHTLVLTGAPVTLAGVQVSAEPRCRTLADSVSAAFAVWEEARKALRSSQLTRLTRAYKADVTTFVRRQSAAETRFRMTDSTTQLDMPLRPFTSLPPDELAAHGYVTRGANSQVFHAPDEDVLLSEGFAATHCLRLLPDSAEQNVIRLGFAPVPGRKEPEIAGVLSIDRTTAELRRLDFSFVNVPATDVVGAPGGQIVFRHLSEGSWMIEQWAIWLPVTEARTEYAPSISAPSTRGLPARAVPTISTRFGMQTTGGHVIRVSFGDETVWRAPAPQKP